MIGALLVGVLALVVVAVIAWPALTGRGTDDPVADSEQLELDAQIEASLRAIREIEFDHRAGNLSDEDFAELDRAERANAARLIRRRDAKTPNS